MDNCSLDDPAAAVLPFSPTPSTTSLGSGLPNEILDAIFENLSRDALTRVALVSHRWRANADRLLYASIVIHEVLPRASHAHWSPHWPWHAVAAGWLMNSRDSDMHQHQHQHHHQMGIQVPRAMAIPAVPVTTLRCCETLSVRPHLAGYVRRFHVRWETDAFESPLFLLPIAHNIGRTLVPTLIHLDSLELSFGLAPRLSVSNAPSLQAPFPFDLYSPTTIPTPMQPPPPPPPPFAPPPQPQQQLPHTSSSSSSTQCSYHPYPYPHPHPHHLLPSFRLPSLRALALHGIGEPSSYDLERILRQHPSLLHLRLSDYRHPLSLAPADVPLLRSFRGYPTTAASILPGRPVQSLGLVGCDSASEEVLASIASGSTPVRSLDLSGMSVTPTLLRSVSRHLSHVEWLKVRLALRHTLHHAHYALSGIRFLTALTTVFASFYNLRGLDLSPTSAMHHQHTPNGTTTLTTTTTTTTASTAFSATSPDGENALEEQRLCVAWMGACPSLRRVVFPSRTEWSLSDGGTWTSGSPRSGSGSGSAGPPAPSAAPDPPRCYLSASRG